MTKNKGNLSYDEQDKRIEELWNEFSSVPFEEDGRGELVLSVDWNEFKKGEERYDIWRWFGERHSKGLNYLLYEL